MRKCRSCGYLLLGEGDTCGRCGAPLTAVTVGAPAAAASMAAAAPTSPAPPRPVASIPGLAPAPSPSPGPPPPTGAPVSAQQQPPALRESWQPIAMPPAPARESSSKKLGLTVLAVVIALVVGAAVMHLRADPLPPGTSEFASGAGITYTSPDGSFQVQLPKAPEMQQQQITVNGGTEILYTAIASTDDYEIGGGSMQLPRTISPAEASAALDTVLTESIKSVNGKVTHKNVIARETLPAIQGDFKDAHGYSARMMVVLSNSSLIVLLVHAKSGVDRLYKALDASLIIR